MAKAVGITEQAYYRWWDTEAFRDWWTEAVNRWAAIRTQRVYGALFSAATDPDAKKTDRPAAQKLWLERFDKGYAPRTRKDINADLTARPARMTDEDRRKLAVSLLRLAREDAAALPAP